MTKFSIVVLAAVFCLASCSGPAGEPTKGVSVGNGLSENYLQMTADLTDAVSLTATIPQGSGENKQLLKITSTNKFQEVFDGKHRLYSYKLTPTHIIAHVNIWEGEKHCSLIAIPKIQGKAPVLCLNRELVSCIYDDREARDFGGYDTHGAEVYFSYQQQVIPSQLARNCNLYAVKSERDSVYSELRHWDGKSEKVTTLFHTDPESIQFTQLLVRDVFTETGGNLCIDTDHGQKSPLFCRKQGQTNWKRIANFSSTNGVPFFKQKNTLLSAEPAPSGIDEGLKFDLMTFQDIKRIGPLPHRKNFELENEGFLGLRRVFKDSVVRIFPDGNSEEILLLDSAISPARLGNWGWYPKSDSLRRFNLTDGSLDPVDYFTVTTLLRLTNVYWTLGDFLRVDGIGTEGLPKKSYLSIKGELAFVEAPAIQVEHPINLQWEK